jgi:hypothetical protein
MADPATAAAVTAAAAAAASSGGAGGSASNAAGATNGSSSTTPTACLSPVSSKYAHSPAVAGAHGSGAFGSGSMAAAAAAAAALNLGVQPPAPLPLGGCVHAHHADPEDPLLWPSLVSHLSVGGASSSGGGAAACGGGGSGWPASRHLGGGAGGAAAGDDRSCYRFGPTRFSVIPKVAVGKISLRFVPQQDHAALIACLQDHVQKTFERQWSANKVELRVSVCVCVWIKVRACVYGCAAQAGAAAQHTPRAFLSSAAEAHPIATRSSHHPAHRHAGALCGRLVGGGADQPAVPDGSSGHPARVGRRPSVCA